MADTPRTLSALLTLLADNTAGNITAQVMRDLLVSVLPSRGQIILTAPVATTFTGAGVYVTLKGTTALDSDVTAWEVSTPANGQLRFDKAVTEIVLVNATLEVLPAANNKRYTFTFARNGVAIADLAFTAFYGNLSGNPAGVFLSGLVEMGAGDTLDVVVKNETDTTSITANVLTLSGVGFLT